MICQESNRPENRGKLISDNTGREYRTGFGGGGGGGDEYRYEMTVTPTIGDDVSHLTFSVNELEWRTFPGMPQFGPRKKVEPGPWRFEVPVIR